MVYTHNVIMRSTVHNPTVDTNKEKRREIKTQKVKDREIKEMQRKKIEK